MHQNPSPVSNDERFFHISTFKFQMALIFRIDQNGDVDEKHIIFLQVENFKWARSRQSRTCASLEKGAGGLAQNKEVKRRFLFDMKMRQNYIICFRCADCTDVPSCMCVR